MYYNKKERRMKKKRWKHICKKCGKVDYTTRTNTVETKTPKW